MTRKNNSFIHKLLVFLSAVTVTFAAPHDASAAIEGSWQYHQAFDRTVSRIIDSERYVNLITQGMQLRMNSAPYNFGHPVIYRIDKTDPDATWRPLAEDFRLSGQFLTDALYNTRDKFLMVVYDDNNIDIIYDDGRLMRIPDLALRRRPEAINVNNICFDCSLSLAYLSTDQGFITVDTFIGKVREIATLGFSCQYAARIGEKMMIVKDDATLWQAPATEANIGSSYTRLKFDILPANYTATWIADSAPVNIRNFVPLGNDKFAYTATPQINSCQQAVLAIARYIDGKWEVGNITPRNAANTTLEYYAGETQYRTLFYLNAVPNRDGYLVKTYYDLVQLKADAPVTGSWDDFVNNVRQVMARNQKEYNYQAGSWDFRTVYLYVDRKRLYTGINTTGNTKDWTYGKDYGLPQSPIVGITNNVAYIPGFGIATASYAFSPFWGGSDPQVPAHLSYYHDGQWTKLSHQHNHPSWLDDTSNGYTTLWNKMVEYYPTNNPIGLTPDPDRPGFVYCGSVTHGITRFDLTDHEAPFLRMTHAKDMGFGLPGAVDMAPTQNGWTRLCFFSQPLFDNKGNLWSAFNNLDNATDGMEAWWWTPEDRKASETANTDASRFKPWKKMTVVPELVASNYSILLPVTIEGGDTRLIITPNSPSGPMAIYDHKGTLDDQSDDEHIVINKFHTPTGGIATIGYQAYMKNDPATSLVWIGGSTGVRTLDPRKPLEMIQMEIPTFNFRDEPGRREAIFENLASRAMDIDASGRKWIATSGLGVVVISADGKTIEGILDTSNSPLPSNEIVGIGCDHETGIVMISTDKGLMEFRPSGLTGVPDGHTAKATPTVVRPGSNIPVTLTGLPSGCNIHVRDANGNIVRNLGRANGGIIQWDTLDAKGERCATGYYRITDGAQGKILVEIKYMN